MKLLFVDDHLATSVGVACYLQNSFDLEWTSFCLGSEAVERFKEACGDFDLVLLSIEMPSRNGMDVLTDLRGISGDVPILIFSGLPGHVYGMRAFQHGANGYVSKSAAAEDLVAAIAQINDTGYYVTPQLSAELMAHLGKRVNGGDVGKHPHDDLSPRERDVLRRTVRGESASAIAEALRVKPSTVSSYRDRIYTKLDVRKRAELVQYAIEHGIN